MSGIVSRERKLQRLWVEMEWRRCAQDERYFMTNYVFIPSEEDPRGRTRFELFDYQGDLLNTFTKNRFVIALKARQIGFTTLGMAHSLWLALFRPGANVLIVSQTQKSSNKNLAQARLGYQFLPAWMKERAPRVISDNSSGMSFEFHDGMISHLKAAPATNGVFAGETATFVLWDEAALVDPAPLQEDVLRTLLPTTDAGGSMLVVSTARGAYNRFAKTYRAAKSGASQFVAFFRPWTVSPFMRCSKDCGWCSHGDGVSGPCNSKYDGKRREFADQPWRFFQEYPSDDEEAFRESGRPRFTGLPSETAFQDFPFRGDLVWRDDKVIEFMPDETGPLRLSTLNPDPSAFYVIGADPSQGVGKDYSTAHVLTMDESGFPEILGYYHSNTVQPTEFAASLDRLGRFFAGRQWAALLAVEDQGGVGALPINELQKHLQYPNAYVHQQVGRRKSRASRFFSFPMTVDRRKAVIDRLARYMTVADDGEVGVGGIYPALRAELGQFVMQETTAGNIRYSADVGCHDDLVMSLAIAVWILVEEQGSADSSPQSAVDEDALLWKSPDTLDLSEFYKQREESMAAFEQQKHDLYSDLSFGGDDEGLMIIPNGYRR
jgi:hypothetical protein